MACVCQCGYAADFKLPFFHHKSQIESTSATLENTQKEKKNRKLFKKKIKAEDESFWKDFYEDALKDEDIDKKYERTAPTITSPNLKVTETPEAEKKKIRNIKIVGTNAISEEDILPNLRSQTGDNFNKVLIQQDLQTIYAMGYFTDKMKAIPTDNYDGTVDITIYVEENIPVTDVQIYGNKSVAKEEILNIAYPIVGKPQNINTINDIIDKINDCYSSKGYILARIDALYDDPDGTINIGIDEGIISKILISGNEKTKDYIIARNIMTEPGMVYNEELIKQDLVRLYSTQAFKEVNREIIPSDENPGKYDVNIIVSEQRTASLSVGGGLDSATGIFGALSVSDNNFRGLNQRVGLSGMIGSGIMMSDSSILNRMNFQAELSFFEPHFLNADNSLLSKVYFRDYGSYQVPLAIETRVGLESTLSHRLKYNPNLSTTFSAGIENISLSEGDYAQIKKLYSKFMNPAEYKRARDRQLADGLFINLAPGLVYDTRDMSKNPRNGTLASVKFEESLCVSKIKRTTGRLSGMVKRYIPVASKSSLSFTARAGGKIHGSEEPEFLAYRLGGPYTIRGFRVNGVGVGDSFVMGSVELNTPVLFLDRIKKVKFFDNLRLAFFVDAGKVFNPTVTDRMYDRPMQAITAGVGLKLFIPGIGPLSLDYGIPLTNPRSYGSKRGYFTFGVGDSINMY